MKSVVRLTDCLDMTRVIDWDVKPQNKQTETILHYYPTYYIQSNWLFLNV